MLVWEAFGYCGNEGMYLERQLFSTREKAIAHIADWCSGRKYVLQAGWTQLVKGDNRAIQVTAKGKYRDYHFEIHERQVY